MYGVLALLAAVENVIPPVPSDAAVALGAFLSNRGLTTPLGVFFVTWIANLAGAAGVYFVARRYGRGLFATRTGRRLLAPRSLAIIEREYLRFGVIGIFVSRFLPGIRAVVPPFAGLINLSPARTLVPMGIASAIWYGGITLLGSLIGAEWERINRIILGVNRTLGIVTAVLIVAADNLVSPAAQASAAGASLACNPRCTGPGHAVISGRIRDRGRISPSGRGPPGTGAGLCRCRADR